MNNSNFFNFHFLSILVVVGIVGLLCWYFNVIVIYILISAILSYMLNPIVNLITQIKIKSFTFPRWVGAIISFCVVIALIAFFISLFMPVLIKEIKLVQSINPDKVAEELETHVSALENFFIENKLTDQKESFILEAVKKKIVAFINITRVTTIINSIVQVTGDILFAIFAVFFMTFFMLREKQLFKKTVINFFPDKYLEAANNSFDQIEYLLSRYFIGIALQCLIISLLVTTGMYFIGVQNSLVIGLFAGLINIIPYIGPVVGIIFGLLVGVSTNIELTLAADAFLPLAVKILSVFITVQALDMLIFQPLIFTKSVFAHPLEIFLIIMIGANIAGPIGMFVAIPSYTILRVTVKEFYNAYKTTQQLAKDGT